MSNPLLGELEIKIGDDGFTLKPTFEGLIEIEKRAGVSISQLANQIMMGITGINSVTAIIFGGVFGFTGGKPNITFNKLGEKIMVHGYANLLADCGQFLAAAISGTNIDECSNDVTLKKKESIDQTLTQ